MHVKDESKMEAAMLANRHRFDIAALLTALYALDYRDIDIEYRSHLSLLHHGALIEAIEFQKKPRRVIVTVNIGLLAAQNPLPSYFRWEIDRQTTDSLPWFLNFFAHHLLKREFLGIFPERDRSLFPDYAKTRRDLVTLLGLRTPSTLHWLFRHTFPELEVAVRRSTQLRDILTQGISLGKTYFGDASTFGGLTRVPIPSLHVTLYCDEPLCGTGQPWAYEAHRRLRLWVFPLLIDINLFLTVLLVLRDQPSFMMLKPDHYLGHQPMYHESQQHATRQIRQVVLFDNEITQQTTNKQ